MSSARSVKEAELNQARRRSAIAVAAKDRSYRPMVSSASRQRVRSAAVEAKSLQLLARTVAGPVLCRAKCYWKWQFPPVWTMVCASNWGGRGKPVPMEDQPGMHIVLSRCVGAGECSSRGKRLGATVALELFASGSRDPNRNSYARWTTYY